MASNVNPAGASQLVRRVIDQSGIKFIEENEGCMLHAYEDEGGIPTIGYGHTKGVRMGQVISQNQADAFLMDDLTWAETAVNENVKVPLTQNQYTALVDFVFNIGLPEFKKSTLLKVLNENQYDAARKEFGRWIYAGGKQSAGLKIRRAKEAILFGR